MKVAIVTANLGGIDPILGIPKQSIDIDYHYYNDDNLPFPLPNLNPRLKSKYIKTQIHRFLPDYDAYIWIDGRVKVQGNNFAESFMEKLKDHDFVIYKHRERDNVFQEMEYIIEQMKIGNQYLLSRYSNQQMVKEAIFYAQEGLPKDYPLFTGGFWARWNNAKVNEAFDECWRRMIEYSYFDQTMIAYITWKFSLITNIVEWDEIRTPKLFTVEEHL